ncbi:hypothetical protein ACFYE9_09615 [Rhizobium leguminosarum]|uniref:Uncharacterized protein n=1 Tax=Rhizobium leguminosarum TaxID=384 RepID=A0ACD5FBV6_RHILE|nr:hypothetical protein [Rhizobium leguminosarum]
MRKIGLDADLSHRRLEIGGRLEAIFDRSIDAKISAAKGCDSTDQAANRRRLPLEHPERTGYRLRATGDIVN